MQNLSGKLTNYKLLQARSTVYKLEENRICDTVLCRLRDGWVLNISGGGHGVVLSNSHSHSHVCS